MTVSDFVSSVEVLGPIKIIACSRGFSFLVDDLSAVLSDSISLPVFALLVSRVYAVGDILFIECDN